MMENEKHDISINEMLEEWKFNTPIPASLEEAREKMKGMSLREQEEYLESIGRKSHIEIESGQSEEESKKNPERFIKVGSQTADREECESDEEYKEMCLSDAKILYEKFPVIFEFYDELVNGIVLGEKCDDEPHQHK